MTCASCDGSMRAVTVHHKQRPATVHQLCPTCITGRTRQPTAPAQHRPTLTLVRPKDRR